MLNKSVDADLVRDPDLMGKISVIVFILGTILGIGIGNSLPRDSALILIDVAGIMGAAALVSIWAWRL